MVVFEKMAIYLFWEVIDFLKSPSSCLFASQPNLFYPEIHEVDLWQVQGGQAVKRKPPFSNARALITRKIRRSKDAQCNTGEWSMVKRGVLVDDSWFSPNYHQLSPTAI